MQIYDVHQNGDCRHLKTKPIMGNRNSKCIPVSTKVEFEKGIPQLQVLQKLQNPPQQQQQQQKTRKANLVPTPLSAVPPSFSSVRHSSGFLRIDLYKQSISKFLILQLIYRIKDEKGNDINRFSFVIYLIITCFFSFTIYSQS